VGHALMSDEQIRSVTQIARNVNSSQSWWNKDSKMLNYLP